MCVENVYCEISHYQDCSFGKRSILRRKIMQMFAFVMVAVRNQRTNGKFKMLESLCDIFVSVDFFIAIYDDCHLP